MKVSKNKCFSYLVLNNICIFLIIKMFITHNSKGENPESDDEDSWARSLSEQPMDEATKLQNEMRYN